MARPNTVKLHSDVAAIELALAARIPLAAIAERHGVGLHAASRHRCHLRHQRKAYWRALVQDLNSRPEMLARLRTSYGAH